MFSSGTSGKMVWARNDCHVIVSWMCEIRDYGDAVQPDVPDPDATGSPDVLAPALEGTCANRNPCATISRRYTASLSISSNLFFCASRSLMLASLNRRNCLSVSASFLCAASALACRALVTEAISWAYSSTKFSVSSRASERNFSDV